ncbi:MAG: PAS domain S-box protein [Anaerolineae bacterium]|nr:PAS domain S-box protein [Anaerolineae bacterium]
MPTTAPLRVLLVEDEQAHVRLIQRALDGHAEQHYDLHVATRLQQARVMATQHPPEIAFVDYLLPDGSGLDLLEEFKAVALTCPVVVLTSHGNEQIAVDALKRGALDYVTKSASTFAEMPHIIQRALREWNHIQERQRTEQALNDSERRFRTLIEAASEGILIVNQRGHIELANAEASRMFGYSRAALLRMSIEDLLPKRLQALHQAHRQRYIQTPYARVMGHGLELTARRHDGSEFPVEVGLSYSHEAEGLVVMAYIIDITDRKEAERIAREKERLAVALEKEQELSELKNRFMSNGLA